MSNFTPEQLAILLEAKRNLPLFAERELKILDKGGNLIPFVMRPDQLALHTQLEAMRRETGMVRALILKSRKRGVSTYVGARYYHKTYFNPGTRTYILTHEDAATQTLFDMVERFYTNQTPALRLPQDRGNAKELRFKGLDSGYEVGTAGAKATGRSKTPQRLHGSEVAFWPNAKAHMSGIVQAIPLAPGTEIILESTANGAGGEFYDLCTKAESGRGIYRLIFEAWYTDPDNVADKSTLSLLGLKDFKDYKPDKLERELAKTYGLSLAQLIWRRIKVDEIGPDKFCQEYPSNAQEAFLLSGRTVFPMEWMLRARRETFSPRMRGDFLNGRMNPRDDGPFRIWDMPVPGERYVIGADVAEGIIGGDFSSADVLRRSDGAQVAQWHGHIDPDRYGDLLIAIGKYYNRATIGVERNNHGLTTLTTMKHRNYPFIYAQKDLEHRAEGRETKKAGWLTTGKSKPMMLDVLHGQLRDDTTGIACAETVDEMMTFMVHEDGSYGAAPGRYDDRVMSKAIADQVLISVR